MDTFDCIWRLLSPSGEYVSRKDACRALWGALSVTKQRQIYWYLREAKKRGEQLDENPYFAINNCNPQPVNWNGRNGINDQMKTQKMVIAQTAKLNQTDPERTFNGPFTRPRLNFYYYANHFIKRLPRPPGPNR